MFIFIGYGLAHYHGDVKTGLFPFAYSQKFALLSHFNKNLCQGLNGFVAAFNGIIFSIIEIFIGNIDRRSE